MRIGWIGGLTRSEAQLEKIAERAGHTLEFHSGDVGGRGAGELRAVVERADFIVIVTEVNSHGAVQAAKKLAHRLGRGSLVIRQCGMSRFQMLLDALAVREERVLAAG